MLAISPPISSISGTFVPTFSDSSNYSWTQSSNSGIYTKVDSLVYISIFIAVNLLMGRGSGLLEISGLPFAVYNTSEQQQFFTGTFQGGTNSLVPVFVGSPNESKIKIYREGLTTQGWVNYTGGNLPTTGTLRVLCSGCYFSQ